MFYEEVQARSLLSKRIVADAWFHSNYSMNVYRGCQFSCAYCDGMAEHYHVDNFREHVRVKINAPNVLEKELERILPGRNKSLLDYTELKPEYKRPIIGISGGVSDSYQQAEKKYQITRKILEVLLRHKLPVFLLTKSDLVLRDIDLLEDINKQSFASVCFTITLMDENQKKIYEPHSSSTEDRFNALKTLRSKGIRGGVMAMPIIPFIGDSIENMMGIVNESKKANSEFVLFAENSPQISNGICNFPCFFIY
jgi:DNA repair photolyase